MRKFWRDARFQTFWRDVGVLVMAMTMFTIPLLVTLSFIGGGWISRADEICSQSERLIDSIEKITQSYEYVAQGSRHRDEYMDKRLAEQERKFEAFIALTENYMIEQEQRDMARQASAGQSAP